MRGQEFAVIPTRKGQVVTIIPTFSIIIPNYNYENYVARAIDSVLAQDFTDYEIIVADDESSDGSWAIIESYADRVTTMRRKNQGAGRTCLMAAREAHGRYIWFLDADDEIAPGALSKVAALLDSNPSKIQVQMQPIDAAGEKLGEPYPEYPADYTTEQMLNEIYSVGYYMTCPTSGMVLRKDVVAAVKDIDYERYIDGVVYLLCPFMGEVKTIYEPLALYRVHDRNASAFDTPSPEKFAMERHRFVARLEHLKEICETLGIDGSRIADGTQTALALELDILERAATGERPSFQTVQTYIKRNSQSESSLKKKVGLSMWAIGMGIAPRKLRNALLGWRPNPHTRPKFLRQLKSIFS